MKMNYTHEAMVDLILQEPTVTTKELAAVFDLSEGWVSRVINSDSFQARIAERKAQLIDPHIKRALDDRVSSVAIKAITTIDEKLSTEEAGAQYALEALGIATGILGKSK